MPDQIFYATYKAECSGCGEHHTLDALIQHEDVDLALCKDCELPRVVGPYFGAEPLLSASDVSKFSRLMGWLFG